MQRYTIFNQLHKGMQSMLSDTARMLQKTDFSKPSEGKSTMERLNRFLRLFNDQAWLEEMYLLPAVEQFAPATVFVLEQDHRDNQVAVQRIKGITAVYDRAVSAEEKQYTGKILVHAFTGLMVLVFRHLSKEEDMINSILWNHYTDTEIIELEQEILSYISPEDLSLYTSRTIRSMQTNEIAGWLQRIEDAHSLQAFHELAAFADHELAVLRTQKERELFLEDSMVA